jgi:hypothetical protein
MADSQQLANILIAAARHTLDEGQRKIEHCVGQLSDAQVWWRSKPEMNSIANLMLHLAGNVRQWIVSGIGGAADVRNRPQEFADHSQRPKHEILKQLQATVAEADTVISQLTAVDLISPRRIQGFDTTITTALFDCISHFRGHVQEIIHMTRQQLGKTYKYDFVPQGAEQVSAGGGSS